MSLFVISAPSGCGKSTVIKAIRKAHPEFIFSVSATTRPPRPDETEGVQYHFLTEEAFLDGVTKGVFLEYIFLEPFYYGTPVSELEKRHGGVMLLDLDVNGALAVREQIPDTVTIMLLPPSEEELERRLRGRDDTPEEDILRRLDRSKGELAKASAFDHTVVNDDLDQAVAQVLRIIEDACKTLPLPTYWKGPDGKILSEDKLIGGVLAGRYRGQVLVLDDYKSRGGAIPARYPQLKTVHYDTWTERAISAILDGNSPTAALAELFRPHPCVCLSDMELLEARESTAELLVKAMLEVMPEVQFVVLGNQLPWMTPYLLEFLGERAVRFSICRDER